MHHGHPRYIGGEWAGPPEDSGGIPDLYSILDARADPEHPSHAEITQWFNHYDPKMIDEVLLNVGLARIANQCHAAKTRIAKKET